MQFINIILFKKDQILVMEVTILADYNTYILSEFYLSEFKSS